MSCSRCLLLIARLCIPALQTDWCQGDSVGVRVVFHSWAPHGVHKAGAACSATVDLLQLCKVDLPGSTESLFPEADSLVHSQVTFEAPVASSETYKYGKGSLFADSGQSGLASTLDRVMSG